MKAPTDEEMPDADDAKAAPSDTADAVTSRASSVASDRAAGAASVAAGAASAAAGAASVIPKQPFVPAATMVKAASVATPSPSDPKKDHYVETPLTQVSLLAREQYL